MVRADLGQVGHGAGRARCPRRWTLSHLLSENDDGEYFEVAGLYREVVPNARLQFTWAWHSTPERESLVTIEIKPEAGGTLMIFNHGNSPTRPRATTHARGWSEYLRQDCTRWKIGLLRSLAMTETHREEIPMQQHTIVSRDQWIEARTALTGPGEGADAGARRAEPGAARTALGQGRQGLCVRRSGRQGARSPTCSRAGRSSWSSISCSRPTGRRPARAARSGPTVSSAWCRISPRATPPWSRSRARRSPSSRPSRGGWAGPSTGCRRATTISTSTSASRSRRSRSGRAKRPTISARTPSYGPEAARHQRVLP